MEENRSLKISTLIKEQLAKDLSSIFYDMFPFELSSKYSNPNKRDRIFNNENTLLTMLLTMTNEDKSLQQSVNIFKHIHEKNRLKIEKESAKIIEEAKLENLPRKKGRRRTTAGRIAKSKLRPISSNTSAYTQARQRVSLNYIKDVFEKSKKHEEYEYKFKWNGFPVFIADGTYLQMQDTKEMGQEFTTGITGGYPRGLLEVIVEQGSGLIYGIQLSSHKKSELEILYDMINTIPSGSLILADDLYNCYAIFDILEKRKIEFIVPGKRERTYSVVKKLGKGDELVTINHTHNSSWLKDQSEMNSNLLLRRIEYDDPNKEGTKRVLYTSLTSRKYTKLEIILKYDSRWDIEISIREIKTIMDINVVRSKTPTMARKEVYSALIVYNYLRQIIMEVAFEGDFSPEGDIIQKFYEINKPLYIDKLGRKYSRWSPGRHGYAEGGNNKIYNTIQAQ